MISDSEYDINDDKNTVNNTNTKDESGPSSENTDNTVNKNDDINTIKETISSKNFIKNDGNITTQNIFNIDYMAGDILSVKDEKNSIESKKQYKLYERAECSEFVSTYGKSLHLAYAIAVALFEYVPVSHLQSLSERLLARFEYNTSDQNVNEDKTYTNPFISLDNILSVIGAKTCIVSYASRFENVTERCICFITQQKKIMENLWELFPMLRNEIITWLIEADCIFQNSNSFSTNCFVHAMANIIKLDFSDSLNRLFPRLISTDKNRDLLIRLFIILVEDEVTKNNAYEVLKQWSGSLKWLWKVPFIVFLVKEPQNPSFEEKLESTLKTKILSSMKNDEWDLLLISGKMVTSSKLRSMVSSIFENLFQSSISERDKDYISHMYLLTIYKAYSFVNKTNIILPLVIFDNIKQANEIEPVILYIVADFFMRQTLFNILEAYINEINSYNITPSILNGLKSFFYILVRDSLRHYNDILRFLSQLQAKNKIAKDIIMFLQEKIQIPQRKDLLLI